MAVDPAGNAYITGNTYSSDFPTRNPYQGARKGSWDAFVTKLSTMPCMTAIINMLLSD
ncbi:MAG: hypothetical protein FJ126_00240 [Deltaproteobacteria bacterium]|nr:hypothetical protein [Deltaproteobacteria bacterium]